MTKSKTPIEKKKKKQKLLTHYIRKILYVFEIQSLKPFIQKVEPQPQTSPNSNPTER